jgi:hypothetical protein
MKTLAALVLCLAFAPPLWAADWYGTWTTSSHPGMTMTIEPYGVGGSRITYRFKIDSKDNVMIIESALNGTDAQVMVNGKPSGETMAIKRLDDRHTSTAVKMNGQPFGNSKSEISVDGKTLNIENDPSSVGGRPGVKTTEIWERK